MDPYAEEKLSHLNDLIKLSRVDGNESHMELNFINSVAARLRIEKSDVERIKNGELDITISVPDSKSKAIEQFHRLIILTGIDRLIFKEEVSFCMEVGVRMGLNEDAIEEVLKKTLRNPTHLIMLDEVEEIFKKYPD
jgi:aspartokinase